MLTDSRCEIDSSHRALYTVGIYREDSDAIYKCCFIQPEVASGTSAFSVYRKQEVMLALSKTAEAFSDHALYVMRKTNPSHQPEWHHMR